MPTVCTHARCTVLLLLVALRYKEITLANKKFSGFLVYAKLALRYIYIFIGLPLLYTRAVHCILIAIVFTSCNARIATCTF